MHTQRVMFKWLAIVIASILFLQFALISPSATAQGEDPPFDQFHWEDWGGNYNQKLDVSPYNVAMDSYYHVFQFSSTPGDRHIRLEAEAAPYTIHVSVRWIYQAPPEGYYPSYKYHMDISGTRESGGTLYASPNGATTNPIGAGLDVQPGATGDLTLDYDIIKTTSTPPNFQGISFDISGTGFGSGASTYIVAINQYGDSDGDGLLDYWEANDTDLNGDGVIDVGPSVGSNPSIKDIYVEVDWMEATGLLHPSHKPKPEAIEKVVDSFAAQGINLHVDVGPASIDYVTGNPWNQNSNGNEFAHEDWIGDETIDDELTNDWNRLKSANFGHSDRVFHHALFVHQATSPVYKGDPIGGLGQRPGQYFFVSLGGDWSSLGVGSINQQAGVFMHELGHNLGLQHGGNEGDDPNTAEKDDFNYKPNYLSVMNYAFNTSGLTINGNDGNMDYSRFDLPDLKEDQLVESNGLNDARVAGYETKYYANGILCNWGFNIYKSTPADQPINWDCDLGIDSQPVQANINGKNGNAQTLTGWDDWANLNFIVGNIGKPDAASPIPITLDDIVNGPQELTLEEDLLIQRISDPRVQFSNTVDVSSVQPGGVVTYTITMFNIDAQDVNGVVVTDTLPAGFSYVTGTTSGATTADPVINGQDLSWSSFVVPANGGELTLTFQATASQVPGTYFNNVSGSSSNGYVVPTGDTAEVEVLPPSFPHTSVLDDFNRANGSIGSNWSGYTTKYEISSNQLRVKNSSADTDIYWSASPFGADQEAYVTFSDVNSSADEQDLLLKAQSASTWGNGVLEVWYDAPHQRAQVWTYVWPQGWVQYGADIPVTFVDGDTFGARARPDGMVEVYRNGDLLATRDITTWPHYDDGGYIGLWFVNAYNARLDDFGGGTVPGGESLMMSMDGPSAEIEAGQLNVELQDANVFWQGVPAGSGQEASVTFANIQTDTKGARLKPQSNGIWGESVVEVLYDVAGQRIQVWMYAPDEGWVQLGKDIPAKFVDGDRFSALVRPDGVLEIYRNGKLFAERKVGGATSLR